ncbi:hypothetical protein DWG18_14070 [Lysobacter sp. TY2-98]|nr:hypothetical protein DWG18_14070 [Lysobacter sp. TY2-98]
MLFALPAAAQESPSRDATAPLPDIEFAADVHMDSIRFASDPQAQVTFEGGPNLQQRHEVEREGLPKPVQGGATYRNVTVRTTISATLLDPLDPLDPLAASSDAMPTSPPPPEEHP